MKDTKKGIAEQSEMGLSLEELIRRGARQVIQAAIEVEVQELLAEYGNVEMLGGQRAVVRNGYLPAREVLTAVGNVEVRVPKVRDRSGAGIKFNSVLVPPFVRRSQRVAGALPWLYLKGISTGDMREALTVLVGDQAKGLSPNVVSRLKSEWAAEYGGWMKRDLSASRYVYWWVDGIHTGLRQENDARQCLLVIIGVTPEGKKELVTIGDGLRESKESWLEVLRDLAARGLGAGPLLAVLHAMSTWSVVANQTIGKMILIQSGAGTCKVITGSMLGRPVQGTYCPGAGTLNFHRYPNSAGTAYQWYRANLSWTGPILRMGGSFAVRSDLEGPGEYSFYGTK